MEHKHHLKGFAYVMFSVLIWSGWVVVSRFGVHGTLSSYDITAIRFTTAGLILLPVAFKQGLRIGPWGYKGGLLLSVLIGACYTNITIAGMKFATVSHASTIINGMLLIMTTVIGMHGLREHIPPLRIAGVLCSLAGIIFMLTAKNSGAPDQWIGHLFFMVGGAMWAGYVLLVRAWKAEPLHAAAAVCVFSMLTYMPLYLIFAHSHIGLSNWREVLLQVVYQGILTGVLALITFNIGIGILGAARASSMTPLIPAISTLLAIPILDEIPSAIEWTGIALVSIGVFLASGALGHLRTKTAAAP